MKIIRISLQSVLIGACFSAISCVQPAQPQQQVPQAYPQAQNTVNPYGVPQTNPGAYPTTPTQTYPTTQTVQAQAPQQSTAVTPASSSYTIKKGDTLYGISRQYGTTVSKLQQANGLTGSNIFPGQSLVIPQ